MTKFVDRKLLNPSVILVNVSMFHIPSLQAGKYFSVRKNVYKVDSFVNRRCSHVLWEFTFPFIYDLSQRTSHVPFAIARTIKIM